MIQNKKITRLVIFFDYIHKIGFYYNREKNWGIPQKQKLKFN